MHDQQDFDFPDNHLPIDESETDLCRTLWVCVAVQEEIDACSNGKKLGTSERKTGCSRIAVGHERQQEPRFPRPKEDANGQSHQRIADKIPAAGAEKWSVCGSKKRPKMEIEGRCQTVVEGLPIPCETIATPLSNTCFRVAKHMPAEA